MNVMTEIEPASPNQTVATIVFLKGHVSPETAYVVQDYPYGFKLRCRKRYWLDCTKNGARLMSQTSDPNHAHRWNKPKASTYCKFGGCMLMDANGHVQWTGLHEYMDEAQTAAWIATYGDGVPDAMRKTMEAWGRLKAAYAKAKAAQAAATAEAQS